MKITPIPNENIKIPFNLERLDDIELNEITNKKKYINTFLVINVFSCLVFILSVPLVYANFDRSSATGILIGFILVTVLYLGQDLTFFTSFPKLVKLLKSDFENGTVEVYCTSVLSSKPFYFKNRGLIYFQVTFEGFTDTIAVYPTENPQITGSEFIIKRLPTSGFILSVKNKNTNTDIQVYFPEVLEVLEVEVNQPQW